MRDNTNDKICFIINSNQCKAKGRIGSKSLQKELMVIKLRLMHKKNELKHWWQKSIDVGDTNNTKRLLQSKNYIIAEEYDGETLSNNKTYTDSSQNQLQMQHKKLVKTLKQGNKKSMNLINQPQQSKNLQCSKKSKITKSKS